MSASPGSPGKIRREHTDRMAVVYVRQSTRRQMLEHTESARVPGPVLVESPIRLSRVLDAEGRGSDFP